eukprot:247804_1
MTSPTRIISSSPTRTNASSHTKVEKTLGNTVFASALFSVLLASWPVNSLSVEVFSNEFKTYFTLNHGTDIKVTPSFELVPSQSRIDISDRPNHCEKKERAIKSENGIVPSPHRPNDISLAVSVLTLLITAGSLSVLCQSETKILILSIVLALYCMTCSALFIPTQITAHLSGGHTCALSNIEKSVKCYGYGDTDTRGDAPGEMGDNLTSIDFGDNFIPTQISVGGEHTCALSLSNTVKCWGDNLDAQLGSGDYNSRGDNAGEMGDNLATVHLGTNFIPKSISSGHLHNCALSSNNTVKCWGWNIFGQLGYGDINNRGDEPGEMGDNLTTVDFGTDFIPIRIVCGMLHTCALGG